MKKLFTKIIAAIAIAAVAVGSIAVFSSKNVQAAEERVVSDKNATAHINADGSGYIEFKPAFYQYNSINGIAGVPLKEIITFNDGGYVKDITIQDLTRDTLFGEPVFHIYKHRILVNGSGPEGFFNGSGHLHFTDKSNDTYDLSIWRHAEAEHELNFNSDDPDIVKISWNS